MHDKRFSLIKDLQQKIAGCLDPYMTGGAYALLDFPDIKNVGDSAIWLGEISYFMGKGGFRPSYTSTLHDLSPNGLDRAVPEGPIFIHGGGNFGDIWPAHQTFRQKIMQRWPDRLIVQLPQSIHYSSMDRADETARVIERCRQFVLLVRDEESLEFARRRFSCEVRLCPDMAFAIGPVRPVSVATEPVLAMLREDREKVADTNRAILDGIPVEDWITESASEVRKAKIAGMLSALPTLKRQDLRFAKLDAAANNRFQRGVRQLSRAETIVTDRLHVHIISVLLGKPHAVLDNSYGKIGRFMSAFSGDNGLSHRASSLEDAVTWAKAQAQSS